MDRIVAAEVFVSIVERGSLTAAAHTLGMSRAMVTRYLAQMEDWAQARLLHRSTRRISLKPAGETTLGRCRELLDIAGRIVVGNVAPNPIPHGCVRVACSQFLAQVLLSVALPAYLRRYPNTDVDLVVEGHAVNLVEERIDLAVRVTNTPDPQLIARPLCVCESVVCAAPSYLRERGVPREIDDLRRHNCLTYTHMGKRAWHFTRTETGGAVSVPVDGNFRANDSMTLLAAGCAGAGVVLQPRLAATPWIEQRALIQLLPDYVTQPLGIHALYRTRHRMSSALRALLDFLVEWFAAGATGMDDGDPMRLANEAGMRGTPGVS